MSKLPDDVRIQIARITSREVWEIRELLQAIQQEVEAREACENIKTQFDNQGKKFHSPSQRYQGSAAALLASERSRKNKFAICCAFCERSHYSASCEEIWDVNKRKEILRRDGRCFVCLQKGHTSRQCAKKCCKCQGPHHQSICKSKDPSKETAETREKPQDVTTKDVTPQKVPAQGATMVGHHH